jgi:FKBP-type peptidyl-prolyl cis-trans isomerase FkpA
MIKKYWLLFSVIIFTLASCGKKDNFDPIKQAADDEAAIQAFIKANNLTNVTRHTSGLYYQIVTPGTGAYPTVNSTVTVTYSGKLLNGGVFDAQSGIKFALSGVIQGWQIGIPLINSGGRIRLLIPSGLAYGNRSPDAKLPANSVLDFTIDLLSFN